MLGENCWQFEFSGAFSNSIRMVVVLLRVRQPARRRRRRKARRAFILGSLVVWARVQCFPYFLMLFF